MASETFWQRQHAIRGNSPDAWRAVGDDLVIAASILNGVYLRTARAVISKASKRPGTLKTTPEELRVLGAVSLLRGAAIEALLKGRAIRRRGHKFGDETNQRFAELRKGEIRTISWRLRI